MNVHVLDDRNEYVALFYYEAALSELHEYLEYWLVVGQGDAIHDGPVARSILINEGWMLP